MRVSIDPNDPGYSVHAERARMLLDGVEVRDAVTADEEQGLVIRYRRAGLAHIRDASDSDVILETGRVRILLELGARR